MTIIHDADIIFQELLEELADLDLTALGIASYSQCLKEILLSFGTKFIEQEITSLDETLCAHANLRPDWSVHKRCDRTLETVVGTVHFNRRYYRHKEREEYCFLMDHLIGIDRYERLEKGLKAEITNLSADHPYRESTELASGGRVSKQSVMRVLREVELKETKPETKRHVPVLHIQADEDHVAMQDGRRGQEVRLVVIHEPVVSVGKKNVLPHKLHLTSYNETVDDFWERVLTTLDAHYELHDDLRIYLHGDGAPWIKSGLDWLDNCYYVLDIFHAHKYLAKIAPRDSDDYPKLLDNLRNGSRQKFVKEAETCLISLGRDSEENRKAIRYLKNHWHALQRAYHLPEAGGSCAEGLVSHCLSARLSSRPMAWGVAGLSSMAQLRAYRLNGSNVVWSDFPNRSEKRLVQLPDFVKIKELRQTHQEKCHFLPMPTEVFRSPKRDSQHRLFQAIAHAGYAV